MLTAFCASRADVKSLYRSFIGRDEIDPLLFEAAFRFWPRHKAAWLSSNNHYHYLIQLLFISASIIFQDELFLKVANGCVPEGISASVYDEQANSVEKQILVQNVFYPLGIYYILQAFGWKDFSRKA